MIKPRYSIIPAGAVTDDRLEGNDLRVLCFLGQHTDKLGWCFLSQGTIAAALGIGRATVQRSLARLSDAGWVAVKSSTVSGRPHACHAYRVIMDRDDAEIGPSELEVEDQVQDGGCPPAGTPGAQPERAGVPAIDGHGGAHAYAGTEGPRLNDLDDGGGVAREAGKLSPECFEIAKAVGVICGYPEPVDWPPKWTQAPYSVEAWLKAGWSRENIIAACTEVMANKRDGPPWSINYFDNAIASFISRRARPMPEVKVQERETVHVVRKTDSPARDEFRQALGELKDFNRGSRARSAGSGAAVQLLPPDRDR